MHSASCGRSPKRGASAAAASARLVLTSQKSWGSRDSSSRLVSATVAIVRTVVKPTTVTANCRDETRPRMPK
jgi:hypothetical protein